MPSMLTNMLTSINILIHTSITNHQPRWAPPNKYSPATREWTGQW